MKNNIKSTKITKSKTFLIVPILDCLYKSLGNVK